MRLLSLLLLVAGSLCAQTVPADFNEGFDKPLRKAVVDLGPSPYYNPAQHVRKTLTCYCYSTFTVKQYDEGQKGAEWLSIVPSAHAKCSKTHDEGEKVYAYPEWSGYFLGVKGMFAFFGAADGTDGGMPFAVFDVRTGRKLFEDSNKDVFRITVGTDLIPLLTYFRVVRAGCNLNTVRADCWKKVRTEFGITQTDLPVCSGYEQADWESAVAYPVSVLLTDFPVIKAVDGPVFCWPIE